MSRLWYFLGGAATGVAGVIGVCFFQALRECRDSDSILHDYLTSGGASNVESGKAAKTLHKAEMIIKDLDYEASIIVSRGGQILHIKKGEENSVSYPVDLVRNNILTHNHTPGGYDHMLSTNDVKNMIANNKHETRAVTRDGYFVSLKKGSGEINPALGDELEKAFSNKAKLISSAQAQAIKKYGRQITAQQIYREAANIVNEWLRENAPKYGYIFTKGKI